MTYSDSLIMANQPAWDEFTSGNPFVHGIIEGNLPKACFLHALIQGQFYLVTFARVVGLLATKTHSLDDLRDLTASMAATLELARSDAELLQQHGIQKADLHPEQQDTACLAYCSWLLATVASSSPLAARVALLPCLEGYAQIGRTATKQVRKGNPYAHWLASFSSEATQQSAQEWQAKINALASRASEDDLQAASQAFKRAVRLEAQYFDSCWNAGRLE